MSIRSVRACTVLFIIVATFALTLFVFLELGSLSVEASSALLWLDPPDSSEYVGDSADVVLQLDNVSNVFGVAVEMNFDPGILSVIDADSGTVGIQIATGTCPSPNFVLDNTVTITGNIKYAAIQISPTPPCDGGDVATISFMCENEGSSAIVITNTLLSDPSGVPIAHSVQNGSFTCDVLPTGFEIIGSVGLQGWSDPSGTIVTLWDSSGTVADGPLAVGPSGAFSLTADDTLETYNINAVHDRYLIVEATEITSTVGITIDLGLATLPAGDLNGDGQINIQDVNLVAGNFGKQSPVSWDP